MFAHKMIIFTSFSSFFPKWFFNVTRIVSKRIERCSMVSTTCFRDPSLPSYQFKMIINTYLQKRTYLEAWICLKHEQFFVNSCPFKQLKQLLMLPFPSFIIGYDIFKTGHFLWDGSDYLLTVGTSASDALVLLTPPITYWTSSYIKIVTRANIVLSWWFLDIL